MVAEALETWLAQVIQAVEPWISQDIDKGLRWGSEIASRLELSKVGIICLTKSNLDARWIHFEAGALSKTKDAYVCTLLLGIKPSDVEQPLAQFQHTTTDKEDIFQLLSTINLAVQKSGERALAEPVLREIFETYWPRLEEAFEKSATLKESATTPSRTTDEMLQEVLEILRNQERRQARLTERAGGIPLVDTYRKDDLDRKLDYMERTSIEFELSKLMSDLRTLDFDVDKLVHGAIPPADYTQSFNHFTQQLNSLSKYVALNGSDSHRNMVLKLQSESNKLKLKHDEYIRDAKADLES